MNGINYLNSVIENAILGIRTAYKGKVLNIPSTPMKETGRYLPNAFLVRSKAVQNASKN